MRRKIHPNYVLALLSFMLVISVSTGMADTKRLNINMASEQQLAQTIKGVGPKKALAIVKYRQQHGPFKQVDDLIKVKGIGPVTLKKNRDKLTAEDSNCHWCKKKQE